MIKKFFPLALLILMSFGTFAQTKEAAGKRGRPDIPGTFVVDIGINRMTDAPNKLKYGLWGSRTLNLYYQYDIRIAKSKFSFHPGIGLGMDRYKMQSYVSALPKDSTKHTNPTLAYDNLGNTTFIPAARYIYDGDTLNQINWSSTFTTRKSSFAMSYLDIPIELRFSTKPEDPARSLKIAVGARFGYLLGAHTKIKYRENHDLKKLKTIQTYNLNPIRYSLYMKLYFGNFGLFTYYNLSELWKTNKGPMQTQTTTYTIGISLSSF